MSFLHQSILVRHRIHQWYLDHVYITTLCHGAFVLHTYVRRGKRMQAADTAEEEQAETLAAANRNPSGG
jgi:hypothetical protein